MISPIKILLVEDNEGDVVLTTEALKAGRISSHIAVAKDGQQALDYLFKQYNYAHAERPDLIILDINLPKIDGKEVLSIMKRDNVLRTIPVVMLTTSALKNDIIDSYFNYANCYITKPIDLDDFFSVMQKIESFWFSTVKLPTQN